MLFILRFSGITNPLVLLKWVSDYPHQKELSFLESKKANKCTKQVPNAPQMITDKANLARKRGEKQLIHCNVKLSKSKTIVLTRDGNKVWQWRFLNYQPLPAPKPSIAGLFSENLEYCFHAVHYPVVKFTSLILAKVKRSVKTNALKLTRQMQ